MLEAASRVFARRGYDPASMDEIASEAGVGKPTLYRYFDGKAALFVAVFLHTLDRLETRMESVLRDEADPEARLRGVVGILVPTFRDHLVSLHVLSQDAAMIDQSKRRIFRERRNRIADHLARALDRPGAAAEPLRTAHLVIGMIWSGAAGLPATDDEIAEEITQLVLHGTGPRAAGEDGRAAGPSRGPSDARPAERIAAQ